MLRKIVAAIVLVPLAIVLIAFAVANRHAVTVSFDPFSDNEPAASVTLPLFVLIILLLIGGVLIGRAPLRARAATVARQNRRARRDAGKAPAGPGTEPSAAAAAAVAGPVIIPPPAQVSYKTRPARRCRTAPVKDGIRCR